MFRCPWCESNPLLQAYHDEEWGKRPCSEEKHFEFLTLECAQAGLSWMTVLRKREAYRKAYAGFDAGIVAEYGDEQKAVLLANPGIIRNRQKIDASLKNARAFLRIQEEFGSFDRYLLSFTGGMPLVNSNDDDTNIPAVTDISKAVSQDMKKRGFSFLGPTVIQSHLQAAGIVDDHVNGCFRKSPRPKNPPVATSKLAVLCRVGKALNKAKVSYGIGGSAMLYYYGLAEDFHDIDIVISREDAKKAEEVLNGMGEALAPRPSDVYVTDVFRCYQVEGVGVDMLSGFALRHLEGVCRYAFDDQSVPAAFPVMGELLPFCTPEEWCVLYRLMPGKEEKAERIRAHLLLHGVQYPDLLRRMLRSGVPSDTARWLK